MENKITIAIVALMVAALVAPGVMAADVSYTASVGSAANVVVSDTNSEFGNVAAGLSYDRTPSIILTNSGNAVGTVTAQFTTNVSASEYGMVNASNVILAEYLKIDEKALNNNGNSVALTSVPANSGGTDGTVSYNATLTVPVGQPPATYTGNVQLNFGTA